jgi:hypothetical protein
MPQKNAVSERFIMIMELQVDGAVVTLHSYHSERELAAQHYKAVDMLCRSDASGVIWLLDTQTETITGKTEVNNYA